MKKSKDTITSNTTSSDTVAIINSSDDNITLSEISKQGDIIVNFNNKEYSVNISKLTYILSRLTSKEVKEPKTKEEVYTLMDKYNLFDETFLDAIGR